MNETWENEAVSEVTSDVGNKIEQNAAMEQPLTEEQQVIAPEMQNVGEMQAVVAGQQGERKNEAAHPTIAAEQQMGVNPQGQNMNQPYCGQQQQSPYQNPYYNPAYQNPYYNPAYQNPYYNPAYQNPVFRQPQPKKQRKAGKFVKFLGIAAASLFFGLIAGGSFIGVNYLYDYLKPEVVEPVQIPTIGQDSVPGSNVPNQPQIQNSTVVDAEYIQGTSVSDIAEAAMPFTVAINCTFTTDSWFGRYETPGSGSGIIVGKNDSELLIVTNNHVINGANTIKVTLIDDTEAEAVVKGTAASTDLAVVAVQLKDLSKETLAEIKVAKLGNSDDIKVGEMVVAIGNALGYGQSVTVGYVSAKDREVTVDNTKMTLLQTDAAINPGNSGGALLNLEGEVIGINSVKYADEDVEGMCFAIPVSNVRDIIEGLMNSLAEDEKGYLGVGVNDVTEAIAQFYNWPIGVYVVNFSENSAAEEAGVQIGDIITGVDGVVVETANELIERVTSKRYGTQVTITLQRNVNGEYQEMEIDVTLRQSAEFTNTNPDAE